MKWMSKTTGEQTAEDWETITQGTHFSIGVVEAKGDVKLKYQFEKEVFFYAFSVQDVWFKVGKKGYGALWLMEIG